MEEIDVRFVPSSEAPLDLLLEADPSEANVQAYLAKGQCYVARAAGTVLGAIVLQDTKPGVVELMNIAVRKDARSKGVGARLLRAAMEIAARAGAERLELGTGAFGYQLRFYQKAGFRVTEVWRDHFLLNYDAPIIEDGVQHKDMLRLAINLAKPGERDASAANL